METVRIDMDQLAHYVQWKMDQQGLSLREAARKARVSAATLSRILRKGRNRPRPDVDTLVKVIRWVDVPIEKIIEPGASQLPPVQKTNTPDAIEVHLRADKDLSAEAAEAIGKMVRVAYAQFVKQQQRSRR
ncbi:MAG: helix-turn-helix transcriptional regulator [Acidobacteriia bacterium]|nr:helix-turn-helix transcriptional regulator [Terriglobia bacterium]